MSERLSSMMARTLLILCLLLAATGGCRQRKNADYIPTEARAQELLEQALTAWRNGKPLPFVHDSPRIELYDQHHKPEQKLTEFTILGPTTGDADRCFAVRLKFSNPDEEVRARFVVFGADPYTVMRYEDYEMLSHWDHPPAKSTENKNP